MTQWYYVLNGQRIGPVDLETIRTEITAGRLKADDLVWCEGLDNWIPVKQMRNIGHNNQPTSISETQEVIARNNQLPQVKATSFKKMMIWLVSGLIAIIAGAAVGGVFAILSLIGLGLIIAALIYGYVIIHRAWQCMQNLAMPRTTPNKAILLLLVPMLLIFVLTGIILGNLLSGMSLTQMNDLDINALLLNKFSSPSVFIPAIIMVLLNIFLLYWNFVVFHGWYKDYQTLRQFDAPHIPTIPSWCFLAYPIMTILTSFFNFFAIIAIVFYMICLYYMCQVINYCAQK